MQTVPAAEALHGRHIHAVVPSSQRGGDLHRILKELSTKEGIVTLEFGWNSLSSKRLSTLDLLAEFAHLKNLVIKDHDNKPGPELWNAIAKVKSLESITARNRE